MQITILTRGILASSGALIGIAVILDDLLILAGSLAGFIFLFTRYLVFSRTVRDVAGSAEISRSLSRTLVRQGKPVEVQVSFTLTVPESVMVLLQDRCPLSCASDPEQPGSGQLGSGRHHGIIRYDLTPLVHGIIRFAGGLLTIQDPFFIFDLPLTRIGFTGPDLHVQPFPIFERSGSLYASRERERIGPVQGFGVRMFREYLPGDDLRAVDWKMSAKRGALYVREYTSQEEGLVMLVVDLPDAGLPFDTDRFSRMVSLVSGYIESSLMQKEPVSLLLVSGANFCDISYEGRDLPGFMALLREQFHPRVRMHHWYRKAGRSDLRGVLYPGGRSDGEAKNYPGALEFGIRIKRLSDRHLMYGGTSAFSGQMARVLGGHSIRDIICYSLCEGDVSHIREVAAIARYRGVRFRVRIPGMNEKKLDQVRSMFRGILVEMV